MDKTHLLIIILSMGTLMIAMRVIPIAFFKKEIQNKFLRSFFAYIPFAVLTSMLIPEVFHLPGVSLISSIIGVIVAFALAYFGQGLLTVSVSAAVVVFIIEWLMKMF